MFWLSVLPKKIIVFVVFVLFLSLVAPPVFADEGSSGIATYIQILDNPVVEGDIVDFSAGGYTLSRMAYDPAVFGVVVKNPAVAFETTDQKDTYPVVSSGKALVLVSTKNGVIKRGDLLTTSTIPGVAEKAVQPSYIIGTALENYSSGQVGEILVVLSMGGNVASTTTVSSNLLQTLRVALSAPSVSPLSALRYVLASILVIVSFMVAIGFFGRVSNTGVEALGRNPLAGRMILFSVVLHLVLAFSIVAMGVGVAYLILVF